MPKEIVITGFNRLVWMGFVKFYNRSASANVYLHAFHENAGLENFKWKNYFTFSLVIQHLIMQQSWSGTVWTMASMILFDVHHLKSRICNVNLYRSNINTGIISKWFEKLIRAESFMSFKCALRGKGVSFI